MHESGEERGLGDGHGRKLHCLKDEQPAGEKKKERAGGGLEDGLAVRGRDSTPPRGPTIGRDRHRGDGQTPGCGDLSLTPARRAVTPSVVYNPSVGFPAPRSQLRAVLHSELASDCSAPTQLSPVLPAFGEER